jgi:glycosyltransferase involved in cell wall biosynthesis
VSAPQVSIVVPTHNRAARLSATLEALARQDWPPDDMEVIVVADGCADDTAGVVAAWHPRFAVRLIQQDASGPAVARNRGAAEARGRYLIFLDDDIYATPGLVRGHMLVHAEAPGQVVVGYLPALVTRKDFFSVALRGWWDAMFQEMWKPGHRFTFRDILSGNMSLARSMFDAVGRFETGLRCHEDYELGIRLLQAGARIRFAPAARGMHDERTTLAVSVKRKFEEGRADVWLLSRHPGLFGALPMHFMTAETRRRRLLLRLAAGAPRAGDALASILSRRLPWYERLRLRYRWRAVLEDLFFYSYWRGVFAAGGPPDVHETRALAASQKVDAAMDVDLAEGLAVAERRLDIERPAAMRLRHGAIPIGEEPAVYGAENLRGEHLRPLLAERLIEPYVRALALAGELPPAVDIDRVAAECRGPATPRGAPAALKAIT